MMRSIVCTAVVAAGLAVPVAAQPEPAEEVLRNLAHPDADVRLAAVRVLREAKHPDAIVPLAALVDDPVDAVQLEAIAAQVSFFVVDEPAARGRFGLLDGRSRGPARAAFDRGPRGLRPQPAPPALVAALMKAVEDETARVREEAIYAAGALGRPPLPDGAGAPLIAALAHPDPATREAAARAAGRLGVTAATDALIEAMNDSRRGVRDAAMHALGLLREARAVAPLTEQFTFYNRGRGARTALEALARIAHPSSVPLFTARVADRDPEIRRAAAEGLGRAGAEAAVSTLETGAANDTADTARAAMTFAMQKLGRGYVPRLLEFLDDEATGAQVRDYFVELGPGVEQELVINLQEPDDAIRAAIADVLGDIGGDASLAALEPLAARDRAPVVVRAASRAIERIRMRASP